MKILIVDDNKNNRMILRLLLEDYTEDNSLADFEFSEAEDGLIAVSMCKKNKYDIVFMDIMMPNMDGIEATKIIRQNDRKVMIIAVSAVDDAKRQKIILSHGAEDYISKPVNSDIFTTRMANYIILIESRENVKIKNEDGINLFTKEIYKHYTNFSLSSEDALSELWEYFLLDLQEKYDSLSDVIRTIFSLGEIQLKLNVKSNLYVEDAQYYKYFTIINLDDVPSKIIELTLKKNEINCEYKSDGTKLTFKLSKMIDIVEEKEEVKAFVPDSVDVSSELNYTSVELTVYDYIEPDDMADLEEYIGRLSSLMLIVGSGDITEDELVEMYTYIEKLGVILSIYPEIYAISQGLSGLASDISTHMDNFMENSDALGPLCSAFSRDLSQWIEQSFHTGAPSINFMNDTIFVNCQTIGSMIKLNDTDSANDGNIDDIFDF